MPNPAGSSTGNHVKVLLPASLSSTSRIQVYNSAGQLILSRAAGQNIYCKPLIKQ